MGRAHEVRAVSIAKTAAKKATVNGRAAKEIYISAKRGGSNPESNLQLRSLMEKAKRQQIPWEVVQRAIKRASGAEDINYISGRYEALGPGGSGLIIEVLTTNVNRASATIREVLNKNNGNPEGKVSFMFHSASIFAFKPQGEFLGDVDPIEVLLLNEVDVLNVEERDDILTIEASFKDFDMIKTKLEKMGVKEFIQAETTWLPNGEFLHLEPAIRDQFQILVDKLEELEDVQNIYHNVL